MGGPNLETRITELRVVAAKAEPAAAEKGEPFELVVWVADPLDRGGDVLTWSCVETLPCEPLTAEVPEAGETTPPIVQTRAAVPAPIWVLACAEGDCGDLDSPPEDRLRDPVEWLRDLPVGGVSAASRPPPISIDASLVNPTLVATPDVALDRGRSEVELVFEVSDAETAFGYATSGGFETPQVEPDDAGRFTLTWFSDPEQESGEVFVVFTNPAGGTEVWQSPVP